MSANYTIKCYMMTSDKRKAVKTKELKYTKTAQLQLPTDEFNPRFVFVGNETDFNYVEIPAWNKKYFVTKPPTFLNGGMIQFDLHEDVLSSAWEYIKNIPALIERNEFQFSNYIIDPKKPLTTKRTIKHVNVGSVGNATGSYIAITVAGGD